MTARALSEVKLSDRQTLLLQAFAAGKMQKQVAAEWNVKASTVGATAAALRKKLGVRTNRELIALVAAPLNVSAELARLRADVKGLEAWRTTMNREINLVTAQRDSALRELAEIKSSSTKGAVR